MSIELEKPRVESVSITHLFGLYNHELSLNREHRVSILHGPNGVGKSVLLRLIAAFFSGRYQEFLATPFDLFVLKLTNGTRIKIYGPGDQKLTSLSTLRVEISGRSGTPATIELRTVANYEKAASEIARSSPYVSEAGGQFYDHRTAQTATAQEIVSRYGTPNDEASAIGVVKETEGPELRSIRSRVSVQLIETQRLLRTADTPYRPDNKQMIATVRTYSAEIVRQIARTLSGYGTESQKLDQTFPQRLISTPVSSINVDHLKERLTNLDEQHTSLNSLGLIDKVSYPATASQIDALDEVKKSVMALYVQDTEKKLKVLEDLARRIQLLLASMNGKFRNKTLSVSREKGLQVIDSQYRPVGLESLSSGEQHELVLWFDLLFKVGPNSLVMIDEPELSLHVTWQKRFLPELLEIARTVPFDVLIATHSPYIIGDRIDLTIPLDADVDE